MFLKASRYTGKNVRILALACFVVLAGVPRYSRCEDLSAAFKAEYSDAAAKLNSLYSHVTIDTKHEETHEGKVVAKTQVEFLREGTLVRSKTSVIQSTDADYPAGTVTAFGGDNAMFFNVVRLPGAHDYTFNWFGPDPKAEQANTAVCLPLFASYCFQGQSVSQYLKNPNVSLVAVTDSKLDGKAAVEVETAESTVPGKTRFGDMGTFRTHFFFFRENWTLIGVTAYPGDKLPKETGAIAQLRVFYEAGDHPTNIKSVDSWIEPFAFGRTRYMGDKYEVTKLTFGAIPKDEFKPAALDIENIPLNEVIDSTVSKMDRPNSSKPAN